MNESVNGDATLATNHKGDGLKDTPNSSRGGCACWLLIVKPDKKGLIIKYRCLHLHRWPELPINLSLWLYFTKCYCSAIMDAWRSVSFSYFFLFLVFLTRWWFEDHLCNPNVTVTLRCQRAPLSSRAFSLYRFLFTQCSEQHLLQVRMWKKAMCQTEIAWGLTPIDLCHATP